MSFVKRFLDSLHKDLNLGIRVLILAFSGLITGLTVAFPQIGFLQWITIVPAGIVLMKRASMKETKLRSVYFDGLVFFYTYYLVCYHFFLSMYPLDFIEGVNNGTAAVVVVVAWFGLSLLQSLFGAFVFWLCAILFRGRICERVLILKPVVVAALWAIFEWSQNFGWWGVPWGRLPLSQTYYIVGIQNASWFGSYFLTFVIVLVNLCIALALLEATKEKIVKATAILAASVITFQYASGVFIWFSTDITEGEATKIACVQGNISASNKWTAETFSKNKEVYCNQTRKAAADGAKIIAWPETAIPFDITLDIYSGYDSMCKNLAKETQSYILVGAYSTEDEKCYNSLLCYTPEGERLDTVYHKRRLVPFGEFIPMRAVFETLIPPLTEILITFDDCSQGEDSNIISVGDTQVGGLICFDSIYDGLTLDTVRDGADFICLSTNDSWFSGSAALRMHNSHAQIRAIESGRYITRSASTGISTVISPRGEVLREIEADTEGYITYDVIKRDNNTFWSIMGNVFVYLCIGFCIVVFAEKIVHKKVKNT